MEEETSLEILKKDYSKIQKKYGLPDFNQLNIDFGIERASDTETDFLIREVRKYMFDKLQNYLRFVETLIHPTNASMFIFSVIKTINGEDKEKLIKIYKKLARYEVDLIELDLEYSEEKEADFVNSFNVVWQEIKKELLEIVGVIKNNWNNESKKKSKAYFG